MTVSKLRVMTVRERCTVFGGWSFAVRETRCAVVGTVIWIITAAAAALGFDLVYHLGVPSTVHSKKKMERNFQ